MQLVCSDRGRLPAVVVQETWTSIRAIAHSVTGVVRVELVVTVPSGARVNWVISVGAGVAVGSYLLIVTTSVNLFAIGAGFGAVAIRSWTHGVVTHEVAGGTGTQALQSVRVKS